MTTRFKKKQLAFIKVDNDDIGLIKYYGIFYIYHCTKFMHQRIYTVFKEWQSTTIYIMSRPKKPYNAMILQMLL